MKQELKSSNRPKAIKDICVKCHTEHYGSWSELTDLYFEDDTVMCPPTNYNDEELFYSANCEMITYGVPSRCIHYLEHLILGDNDVQS